MHLAGWLNECLRGHVPFEQPQPISRPVSKETDDLQTYPIISAKLVAHPDNND